MMKQKWWILAVLVIMGLVLWTVKSGVTINSVFGIDPTTAPDTMIPPSGPTVTVLPTEIDDILYNPGMGSPTFISALGAHCRLASIPARPSPTSAGPGLISSLPKGNTTSVSSIA